MEADIRVLNFEKAFVNESGERKEIISGISLEFQKGDFVTLIGANGSGKSTLLNAIAGSEKQDKGILILNGKNLSDSNLKERSKYIGRVMQNPGLGTAGKLTLLENLRLAFLRNQRISPLKKMDDKFRKTAAEKVAWLNMGLEKELDKKMENFSGGQRQALSLIMSVMQQPELLLMDEPTSALDPKSSKQLLEIAQSLAEKLSLGILMVTHNFKDAIEYGNQLVVIKEGKIAATFSDKKKLNLSVNDLYRYI